MRALHRRLTLSALTEPLGTVSKHLGLIVHDFTAQAAIYLIASVGLLNLSACSSVRLIDSQVSAFSSTPAWPPDARYRFERLPSQQAQPERQAQLEAMAETALRKVGAVRSSNDAAANVGDATIVASDANTTATPAPATTTAPASSAKPTHIVQLTVRSQEVAPASGFGFSLLEPDYVVAGNGHLIPLYHRAYLTSPLYQREVSIVLRQMGTNAVVFESKAVNENPWPDTDAILPALLDAALQGFPNPPSGVRRVAVEIPR
jgi:hypothetical protein